MDPNSSNQPSNISQTPAAATPNQPTSNSTPPQPASVVYLAPVDAKKSGMAVASMVLGIIGICLSWTTFFRPSTNPSGLIVLGVLALIFGIISTIQVVQRPNGGINAKAIAGTVMGFLTVVIGMIALLAVYLPNN